MKFIILIAIIYGVYRVSQVAKIVAAKKAQQLNQEKDDGFIDYEEVD